ncbi:MAG: hypothetical protein U9Q37_10490 [Euryarchaeota archaeon]|nr:hypothetical protein [Euryarchaeota archaeon]
MTEEEITKQGDAKRSRKFWVTLGGLGVILVVSIASVPMGVPGEEISGIVTSVAGIVGAYVIGQGYADGQAVKK